MLIEKARKNWHDVKPGEGCRRRHAQASDKPGSRASCGQLGFVGFSDGNGRPLEESLPRFGGHQAMCRADQKANLEAILELRDRFRHRRLADIELTGGRGEGARFDHAHKGGHRLETIHVIPLWN